MKHCLNKQCKTHMFSLFFKMLFWYPREKSKLVKAQHTQYKKHLQILVSCYFGSRTLDLSTSDRIIFKRSYGCNLRCKLLEILEWEDYANWFAKFSEAWQIVASWQTELRLSFKWKSTNDGTSCFKTATRCVTRDSFVLWFRAHLLDWKEALDSLWLCL